MEQYSATGIRARFALLTVELPGRDPLAAGVLLEDPANNRLHLRLRRDWHEWADGENAEVLSALEQDLDQKAQQSGADQLLRQLEDSLSNVLHISERKETVAENFSRTLSRLYRENVRSEVLPFTTHLPRYSLAVAAGPFLENREVMEEGWEEAPPSMRLTKDMFIARIEGRSMEPLIPDGSLCVFRRGVTGSRQGRLVLVEARGENDRYTVKRYRSEKRQSEDKDAEWSHTRIRLESLNPEFPSWDLDPQDDRYYIVGEFMQVLD